MITDPSRPLARSPQFFEASDQELADAARACVAYSGRWTLRGSEIVHDVEQSLFPNWAANPLTRAFLNDGEHLILTTAAFSIRAAEYSAALVWEKET